MPDIRIDLARQWLELRQDGELLLAAPVSTAAAGLGERFGSFQTPRGRHVVRARIGAGAPVGAVFVGRRWTGEVYSPQLAAQHPGRDWILTRILWLSGCEVGRNRLGQVDTLRRYIYIHGTPDSTPLGTPGSKGCVRMANADLLRLFELTPAGTPVDLVE
ncbi:L,D-transpeptidase family protein [Immundisolibacter sp.]